MTLAQLLALAAQVQRWEAHQAGKAIAITHPETGKLAAAVLDLLADNGTDCGMPMPLVAYGDHKTAARVVMPGDCCGPWDPADARSFARALLAAADEAEGKGEG